MAQPRQASRAPRATSAEEDQLRVVRNLSGAVTIVMQMQPLANNALRIHEVLGVLHARPAEGEPGRRVYDEALRSLGGSATGESERRAAAITALNGALMNAIRYLEGGLRNSSDITNGAAVQTMLSSIQSGMSSEEEAQRSRYGAFRTIALPIQNVLSVLRGGAPASAPAEAETAAAAAPGQARAPNVAVSPQEFALRLQTFDIPGRIHQISVGQGERYYAVGGDPSPMQLRSFSDRAAADAFVSALSFARAAQLNGDDQGVGCPGLIQALEGVSNPQIRSDSRYGEAMDLLRAGQRDAALAKLRELDPLFNNIWSVADRQVVVRLDNRFVSVFTARGNVFLDIAGSMAEFEAWLRSGDERSFGRAVVTVGLGAAFDLLRGSGQRIETIGGQEVSSSRVPASGFAVSATPQLAVTTSAGRTPLRILAHCNFGYRDVSTDEAITVVTQTGAREQQRVGQSGAYLGIWGLEFQFPRLPTDTRGNLGAGFSIERVGAGALGHPANALAYITFSRTHTARADMSMRSLVTPMYSGFLTSYGEYQPRPGVEVDWFNWSQQFGRHMVSLSPVTTRLEYNTTTRVATLDNSAALTYSWSPAWEASARVGYLFEAGGRSASERLPGDIGPGYLFGGLGLTWRPGAESRAESPSTIPRDTVPTRVERETPLARSMREADEYVRTHAEDDERSRSMARDLAGSLEGWRVMNARADLTSDENYTRGIEQLRAGNLRGGLELLRNVSGLR